MGTAAYTPTPGRVAAATEDVSTPSANTAATVTYAAGVNGRRHVVGQIFWSYAGGTPTGNIKIEDGVGNVVFSLDITGAGPGWLPFTPAKYGSANTAMIITLSAAGGGITGKLAIGAHWIIDSE